MLHELAEMSTSMLFWLPFIYLEFLGDRQCGKEVCGNGEEITSGGPAPRYVQ